MRANTICQRKSTEKEREREKEWNDNQVKCSQLRFSLREDVHINSNMSIGYSSNPLCLLQRQHQSSESTIAHCIHWYWSLFTWRKLCTLRIHFSYLLLHVSDSALFFIDKIPVFVCDTRFDTYWILFLSLQVKIWFLFFRWNKHLRIRIL